MNHKEYNFSANKYLDFFKERGKQHLLDIYNVFLYGKIKNFEIDDYILNILLITNNDIHYRRCPFPYVFLDCKIPMRKTKIGDVLIRGILLIDSKSVKDAVDSGEIEVEDIKLKEKFKGDEDILFFAIVEHSEEAMVNMQEHYSLCANFLIKEQESGIFYNHNLKDIKRIICNYCDFLNHPQIETKISKWGTSDSRIKRGKFPVPDMAKIYVNGMLNKYIYEDFPKKQRQHEISCSFWVRGHYYHFWNKERWNKIYSYGGEELRNKGYQRSEGVISKWIAPSLKGKGKEITKTYKVRYD